MGLIRTWIGKLNLWPQMALAITLGFLALFIAFSLLGERAVRDSSQRILDQQLVIAKMAASQIDQWLQEEIDELEQASIRADFDPLDPNLEAEVDLLAYTYSQLGEFSPGFTLLDPHGRVIISGPDDLYLPGTDLADLPHIATVLAERQATISAPFKEPLSDLAVTALTVPMYDGDRFKGLLIGLVDLDRSGARSPLKEAKALSLSTHADLVDSEGRVLDSAPAAPFLSFGRHFAFYRRALAQGSPIAEFVPLASDLPDEPKDHLHAMAFAPLQSTSWGVAVGGDQHEIFAGVERLRAGLIVIGIIAMIVIWGGTLIGARSIIRPIQKMTRIAQQIAKGELHTAVQAGGGNETQVLALALENMRLQFLSYIDQLTSWNQTLEARVDEQTADLRQQQVRTRQLLGQVITAQEEERARVARELHDELGQTLTAVDINLDLLGSAISPSAADAQALLEKVRLLTAEIMVELRHLIAAMRPGVLDKLGLIHALGWIANQTLRPLKVEVELEAGESIGQLPDEIETTLFRIAQEAINNIARHSQARHVTIHLERDNGNIRLTISDDGKGWDQAMSRVTSNNGKQIGLTSMRERALLVGGQVKVESTPGLGTVVQVIVPLPVSEGEDHVPTY